MGVMKDSKNQELARKLIDFCMTEEVQVGFAKELYYGPTNSTVTLDQEIKDKVVYGKEQVEALITPDWNEILPKREEWLTKWTEVTSQ
jgi:putative spermidine/putrescine transport system substrate-binding protein